MSEPCCRFEDEFLSAFEQGLPLDEAHFAECPDCRDARAKYQRLVEAIPNALPQASLSPDWEEKVLARAVAVSPTRVSHPFAVHYRTIAGMLAVAAAIFGVFWVRDVDEGKGVIPTSTETAPKSAVAPAVPSVPQAAMARTIEAAPAPPTEAPARRQLVEKSAPAHASQPKSALGGGPSRAAPAPAVAAEDGLAESPKAAVRRGVYNQAPANAGAGATAGAPMLAATPPRAPRPDAGVVAEVPAAAAPPPVAAPAAPR